MKQNKSTKFNLNLKEISFKLSSENLPQLIPFIIFLLSKIYFLKSY